MYILFLSDIAAPRAGEETVTKISATENFPPKKDE